MRRIYLKSFILVVLFPWLFTLNYSAFAADCTGSGKPIGAECYFEDCECASEICANGRCVECASDSDCQGGQHCVEYSCQ